jgi:three-Cys-motif partner protein
MTYTSPTFPDDGLITPEIGAWGEEKYRLVGLYAQMFSASMKGKWDCRVYVDLFAGSGRSRIEGTSRIVAASPLAALSADPKFDKYIFCEQDADRIGALEARVKRDYPTVEAFFLPGDVNMLTDRIITTIPRYRKDFNVLSFCFVDPYKLKNLTFETVRRLSSLFMDFLVLIPSDMDANRNVSTYELAKNSTVEKFLNLPGWRSEWQQEKSKGAHFGVYLVKRFGRRMVEIGYLPSGIEDAKHVRSTDKNLPLYHLAFFSRHKLAMKLWRQAIKYSEDQLDLFP